MLLFTQMILLQEDGRYTPTSLLMKMGKDNKAMGQAGPRSQILHLTIEWRP